MAIENIMCYCVFLNKCFLEEGIKNLELQTGDLNSLSLFVSFCLHK